MEYSVGSILNGFEIKKIANIDDCKGTLYEMVHIKTGAGLCWLKRDDINKTFSITFKTIPENDTGVFHIIEHTVLNGSKKYPVREPFVELLKSSLQTFLNAFTYPDKTMYPVSSRNEKDFMNLMSVYMDAVFHPAIYSNKNIFYQEGWHYEIRDREEDPVYKGVVLNEMKGAFSSVDEAMVDEFNRMLFPENCYKYVSGGDPKHIPDLTYEKYIETHKRFYHPSNARVFLDGDLDIETVTKFIDSEYFSQYEKEEFDFTIPTQSITSAAHNTVHYEISEEEDLSDKTQIGFAKIVSTFDNVEKNVGWAVLSNVLTDNNEAPLKKAILEKGLGEDVELDLYDGIQQPWAILCVRNTNEEKFDEIKTTLQNVAKELITNGLNHEDIKAELNQMEFRYREKHEPAGVMYAQRAMESWLYGGDPADSLSIGYIFDELRKKADEGFFESLLEEFLLDEEHLSTLISIPDPTLGIKRNEEEKKRLLKAKASWGDEIENYIALNKELDTWQATPDSKEVLDTLPKLSLKDVKDTPEPVLHETQEYKHIPELIYPEEETGIVYMNFYFNMAGVKLKDVSSVGFFSLLLSNLPTQKKNLLELQAALKKYVGSMHFFIDCFTPDRDGTACYPVIGVSISVLKQNVQMALELVQEVMQETVFDKEMILDLLKQDNEDFRQSMIMNGHSLAMRRVSAHLSAEGVFREAVGGFESNKWEKSLEENFDTWIDGFVEDCKMYREVLFSKARATVSFSGSSNKENVEAFLDTLSDVEATRAKVHYPLLQGQKECILIPAGIAYSAYGSTLRSVGVEWTAEMTVASHILTYDWLWNEVRVKGGAYGTGFSSNPNGNFACFSFRDPSPIQSKKAFERCGSFLQNFEEEGLDQYIIGSIAGAEPLIVPSQKIRVEDGRYFAGITYEERCENRKKILHLTRETLQKIGEPFEKGMNQAISVIVAGKDVIEEAKKKGYIELTQNS